jgi:hypothetical protein
MAKETNINQVSPNIYSRGGIWLNLEEDNNGNIHVVYNGDYDRIRFLQDWRRATPWPK